MSTSFEAGVLNGKYSYYHPNGRVDFEGFYQQNLRVGEWFYFSDEGLQDTVINYNE